MPFDRAHLQAPFQKLAKSTRMGRNKLADPKRVHKLRTSTRRVEAILGALRLEEKGRETNLLNRLKKIRRAAGVVRDMDVLTTKAAEVSLDGETHCHVRLLEHLGAERHRHAERLRRLLGRHGKAVRRHLQRCEKRVERLLSERADAAQQPESGQAATRVLELSAQLQKFATLSRRNLHEYRKQGKQLRYVLQMAHPQDEALVNALEHMQDAIGEWHDWEELVAIAKNALDHPRCALIRELELHADQAFDEALRVATATRKRLVNKRAGRPPLQIVRDSAPLAA